MNRNTIIAAFFALLFLAGHSALAQSGYDLFQKGLVQERTEGDLDEAIRLYKQIVADHKDDRALVAKTLIQMGGCYEKLGRAEAQKAYQRVIQEFADQPEPVRIARKHLQQFDTGAPAPTYRLVLDEKIAGMPVGLRDFSPSGDRIVFGTQDKSGLYIADQTATIIRPLLDDLGPWEIVGWPRWSPDGRLIAYKLSRGLPPDSGPNAVCAIFVLNPDGGAPRQIGPDVRQWIWRLFWTPDGRHLTYSTGDGLRTLTLDGNEVRFIPKKDLPDVGRWDCGHSPNGRWLVSHRKKENGSDTDLCIFPATGGTVRRLTHLPGVNHQATWAPDGRTLYFVSGTADALNIWKLPMDPETGLPKGRPQQVTFFKDTIVALPKVLGDGSRIAFTMSRTNTSIQVADASSPHEARTLVRSGKYSPELSPDGQTVYYVNDTPCEEGIYAVPRQGGAPRRLTESLPAEGSHSHLPRFDLSPDGRILAYCAKFGNEQGLFTLPTSGGEPRLLVQITRDVSDLVPQWSPDGSLLAYADGNDLYVIPAAGGQPHELAHVNHGWEQYTVRWSPDGKLIAAFGMPKPNSNNAVYVVPASGGELRQLTPYVDWKEGLEWHPGGKRLTYHMSRYHSETRQAYLDGRPPSLLVDVPDIWDYVGIWAPDGLRFFFKASVGSNWGMYVYDEASAEIKLVSPGLPDRGVPCWSRDGKTMAWWATKSTIRQTWIMENFLAESKAGE